MLLREKMVVPGMVAGLGGFGCEKIAERRKQGESRGLQGGEKWGEGLS